MAECVCAGGGGASYTLLPISLMSSQVCRVCVCVCVHAHMSVCMCVVSGSRPVSVYIPRYFLVVQNYAQGPFLHSRGNDTEFLKQRRMGCSTL